MSVEHKSIVFPKNTYKNPGDFFAGIRSSPDIGFSHERRT